MIKIKQLQSYTNLFKLKLLSINMQIIGFNFSKILAQRKEKLEGKLEINQKIDIDDIIKEKVSLSKDQILRINFTFSVEYSY